MQTTRPQIYFYFSLVGLTQRRLQLIIRLTKLPHDLHSVKGSMGHLLNFEVTL